MSAGKPSQVLSIRIDPDLLEAVRERATAEGRSVSGEIVFLVRQHLDTPRPTRRPSRPITGWLAELDVPTEHSTFREARARASAALARAVSRKGKRRG
jgi:hypothetical protein